jgi:hypothetical protein
MIVDLISLFNEVDVLRARVDLLRGQVDRHLVVEGNLTHQGDPKLLYLDGVELDETVQRVRVDLTHLAGNWEREAAQRDYGYLEIQAALEQGTVREHDLVLLTDVDELPNPWALERVWELTAFGPVILQMRMIYYGAWEWPAGWFHAKACRVRDLPENPTRDLRMRFDLPVVTGAGWHVSYLGEEDRLRTKIESFAHAENLDPEVWERIRSGRDTGTGPNGEQLARVEDASRLPPPVRRLLGA